MVYKKTVYVTISIAFAVLFIYMFFPYSLIKEIAISKVQVYLNELNPGLKVQVDSLSSYWLTGIQIKNLRIDNVNESKNILSIDKVTLRLSMLPLFIGRINVNSQIKIENGAGDITVSTSIFDLVSKKNIIRALNAKFNDLKLDGFYKQLIYILKNNNDPGFSLIAPMIVDSSLGGYLDGHITYQSSQNNISEVNLKLKQAFLDINNSAVGIPMQNFSVANINIQYQNSVVKIKKETRFTAQNFSFGANGEIKNVNKTKMVNMKLDILLSEQIEKNFGFLLPQLLKCPSSSMVGGIMNVELTGSADNLSCH